MAGVTPLLERQTELRVLRSAVDRASDGHGSTVVVSGEAGIGKTSLIRAFLASLDGRARVLEGACDDLLSPRRWTARPIRRPCSARCTRSWPIRAARHYSSSRTCTGRTGRRWTSCAT